MIFVSFVILNIGLLILKRYEEKVNDTARISNRI